jgi:L-ascorbate metabolism protein UlaG (beta-lactamase superfamily)
MITRRSFIASSTAAVTFLPFAAQAAAHAGNSFASASGKIEVFPVDHASFVMPTPAGVIYNDPIGDPANYADFADADLILVTHHHGDHYNQDTLNALVKDKTKLITNQAVYDKMPAEMQAKAQVMVNGDTTEVLGIKIDAIPAHNLTEGRMKFHPVGRDNGYVLTVDGLRIYISGDTEDLPEMRALKDIDVAFVCMNLPFTMDINAAASAVAEFAPTYVYPYHYRGKDGGTQDPAEFAKLVGDAVTVKMGGWYG